MKTARRFAFAGRAGELRRVWPSPCSIAKVNLELGKTGSGIPFLIS
jgi:hypothetical protein